jgi:hypothetical protein
MNYILNLYSQFVAKRFETLYSSPSVKANMKAPKVLEHYRSVRRMLPLMSDGNHMGNHNSFATQMNGESAPSRYNGHNAWYATQGQDVR